MEEVADGFFNYGEYAGLQDYIQSGAPWYSTEDKAPPEYVSALCRAVSPPPLDRVLLPPSPLKPPQPPAQSVPMAFVHARDLAKTAMPPPPPRKAAAPLPKRKLVVAKAIHHVTGTCIIFGNSVDYARTRLPTNEELTRRYESNSRLHMGMTGATVSDHPT